jgi:hypothetical protein
MESGRSTLEQSGRRGIAAGNRPGGSPGFIDGSLMIV